MRDDLKGHNLTITEIAKLVGENWQYLDDAEKEQYGSREQLTREGLRAASNLGT